jgi:hypothetical protein
VVKKIEVDRVFILVRVISVAHYPDTFYIIWKKILQPHFSRLWTCPRFKCMATEIIHGNHTGLSFALASLVLFRRGGVIYSTMYSFAGVLSGVRSWKWPSISTYALSSSTESSNLIVSDLVFSSNSIPFSSLRSPVWVNPRTQDREIGERADCHGL